MANFQPEPLIEAVPYILRFRQRTVVVKMGGSFLEHEAGKEAFIQDIALLSLLGIQVVVVHGGGKAISERLERLGIESAFIEGYRFTHEAMVDEVEMTLSGSISKEIVHKLGQCGVKACSISGKDGLLMKAQKMMLEGSDGPIDIGMVGEVTAVNPELVHVLIENGFIPVISPIGIDDAGQTYNINADTAAAAIAAALEAEKLVLMTDVNGFYSQYPDESTLISQMTLSQCKSLLEQSDLGGMKPKLACVVSALQGGVNSVHLINGSVAHSLLTEIFSVNGIGTMIIK